MNSFDKAIIKWLGRDFKLPKTEEEWHALQERMGDVLDLLPLQAWLHLSPSERF